MAFGSWRFKSSPAHRCGRPRRGSSENLLDSPHADDRARGLPAGLPGHLLVAGRGRGRPRSRPARRSRASVHARRALPQGQPLPRRAARPRPGRSTRCAESAPRARAASSASAGTRRSSAAAAGLRSAIERHGPESVLPYYFAGTEGMVQGWIMGPRLFAALGASRLRTTICTAAAGAALRCHLRRLGRAWIPRTSSTRSS